MATIYDMFKVILFSAHHTGTSCVVQYTGGVLNYCMHDGIPRARPVLLLHSFCLVVYIRIIYMYLHIYICMYVCMYLLLTTVHFLWYFFDVGRLHGVCILV